MKIINEIIKYFVYFMASTVNLCCKLIAVVVICFVFGASYSASEIDQIPERLLGNYMQMNN